MKECRTEKGKAKINAVDDLAAFIVYSIQYTVEHCEGRKKGQWRETYNKHLMFTMRVG